MLSATLRAELKVGDGGNLWKTRDYGKKKKKLASIS